MKSLKIMALSAAALALTAVDAVAQTWICDSKASVGYDIQRDYEIVVFGADRSYRIKIGLDKEELSLLEKNTPFFEESDRLGDPASIQLVGSDYVYPCEYRSEVEYIHCDGLMPFGSEFLFSLNSGRFSIVNNHYPLIMPDNPFINDGRSHIEVGECRRSN